MDNQACNPPQSIDVLLISELSDSILDTTSELKDSDHHHQPDKISRPKKPFTTIPFESAKIG